MVIIELIDFRGAQNVVHQAEESQTESEQEIKNLFQQLTISLQQSKIKKFSLDFSEFGQLKSFSDDFAMYEMAFSDQFDRIIVGCGNYLVVYRRLKSNEKETIINCLFSLEYAIGVFHCLRVVNEDGEEFIYATTSENILKIRVRDLMRKDSIVVWSFRKELSNIWGLDVSGTKVYALDFNQSRFYTFNRETGEECGVDEVSTIYEGYALEFLSENMILISHHDSLEIFEKQGNEWVSHRKTSLDECENIYSLFYEKISGLIYVSDTHKEQIFVIRLSDFSLVKKFSHFSLHMNYGLAVDQKSGFLYVCNRLRNQVLIFK